MNKYYKINNLLDTRVGLQIKLPRLAQYINGLETWIQTIPTGLNSNHNPLTMGLEWATESVPTPSSIVYISTGWSGFDPGGQSWLIQASREINGHPTCICTKIFSSCFPSFRSYHLAIAIDFNQVCLFWSCGQQSLLPIWASREVH